MKRKRDISSCATAIIARGRLFSGNLIDDDLVVTELAVGSKVDWPGAFGDPQLNQMAVANEPAAENVALREIRVGDL